MTHSYESPLLNGVLKITQPASSRVSFMFMSQNPIRAVCRVAFPHITCIFSTLSHTPIRPHEAAAAGGCRAPVILLPAETSYESCSHCSDTIWREAPTGTGTAMCRVCVAHPSLVQACEVCFDACRAVQMACTPKPAGLVSDFRGHTKAKHPVCRGCLGSWVSACLDEGRHEVLCPNAECSMCLTDTQLTEYTSSAHQPRVCEQQRESLLDRRRDAGMARLLQMVGHHGWCFRRLSPQPLKAILRTGP